MAGYSGYGDAGWAPYGYGALNPPTSAQKSKYMAEFSHDDPHKPRTMFVEGLAPGVTEELVFTLFGQIGQVTKCKLILEPATEPFAFVEFIDHDTAAQALIAMNKRLLLEHEMKVSWASTPQATAKVDTTNHFHVFVGDLSPEVDNKTLREAFQVYGELSDCKVIRDAQTLMSKGYGFATFIRKEEAEKSIEGMNGQWLGRRAIRTNWATRKPGGAAKSQTYDEVITATTDSNTTVYVGGTSPNITEEDIRKAFGKYGAITEVRLFKAQGYAFVRFDAKEAAAHSIVNLNGAEVGGSCVRCSWGRQQEPTSQGAAGSYGYAYGYAGAPGTAAPAGYGAPAAGGAPPNQAAWNQYWQQYYSNPAVMQQWQSYYQQQQQ